MRFAREGYFYIALTVAFDDGNEMAEHRACSTREERLNKGASDTTVRAADKRNRMLGVDGFLFVSMCCTLLRLQRHVQCSVIDT